MRSSAVDGGKHCGVIRPALMAMFRHIFVLSSYDVSLFRCSGDSVAGGVQMLQERVPTTGVPTC